MILPKKNIFCCHMRWFTRKYLLLPQKYNWFSYIDSKYIRPFTAAAFRCIADLWRWHAGSFTSRPDVAASSSSLGHSVYWGSSWQTRWCRWQWNLCDWMEHFAETQHTTFDMFKITCEKGSGPVSLMIKIKHTSFPWKVVRLGCKSKPTTDTGNMWDPATLLLATNTLNS